MTTLINAEYNFMKLREWIPIDKVDWHELSYNPNAIHILEKNLDKVNWDWLSQNPNAIHILEKNIDKLDKVSWYWLSKNPNAIHILENNLDKVSWENLSRNPNIFEYDYAAMINRMYKNDGIAEDLMKNRFHPRNMTLWNGWGHDNGFDDE
jgi:hypothetical protein